MSNSPLLPNMAIPFPKPDITLYSEVRRRWKTSALRQTEIPTEHEISLPLPTLRCGSPGYAYFAAPAVAIRDQQPQQDAPDRWWVIDALGGRRLLIYTQWRVQPFASVNWQRVTLPDPLFSMSELLSNIDNISLLMDQLAPAFFRGEPGEAQNKELMHTLLVRQIPAPLMEQYRALASDFFVWLEASAPA